MVILWKIQSKLHVRDMANLKCSNVDIMTMKVESLIFFIILILITNIIYFINFDNIY